MEAGLPSLPALRVLTHPPGSGSGSRGDTPSSGTGFVFGDEEGGAGARNTPQPAPAH
jgi:hypothetical protein